MIAYCALFLALGLSAFATPLYPEASYSKLVQGSRIVSGWEAEEGQFPYQLGLRLVNAAGQIHACGASLIDAEWALTAAHCVAQRINIIVTAGSISFARPGIIIETTEYVTHPDFSDDEADTVQPNDIALIKFGTAVSFTDRIQPIRLQSTAEKDQVYDGVRLQASGWGTTWTGGSTPDTLNWVYLRAIPNSACSEAYGLNPIIQDSTICTIGYSTTSQSTCNGDNGSPLAVVDEDGEATLVGVSSFMPNLGCHLGIPAGFVRPGYYHEWFSEVTGIEFEESVEVSSEESGEEEEASEESTEEPEEDGEEDGEEEDGEEEEGDEEASEEEEGDEEEGDEEDGDEEEGDEDEGDEEEGDEEEGDEEEGDEEEGDEEEGDEDEGDEEEGDEEEGDEEEGDEEEGDEEEGDEEEGDEEEGDEEEGDEEEGDEEEGDEEEGDEEEGDEEEGDEEEGEEEEGVVSSVLEHRLRH